MKVKIPAHSHLLRTPLFQLRDKKSRRVTSTFFWGRWTPIDFEPHPEDAYYTLAATDVGALDTLAWRYYGFAALWWVIARANRIDDPLSITPGDVVRIPARRVVLASLSPLTTQTAVLGGVSPLAYETTQANTFSKLV